MEAQTLCALMLKAKKVFAKEQTFLSFPISPLPHTPRELNFFDQSNAAALSQSIHFRARFSTLVDLIPTGEAWQPAGDTRLSDVYDSVLNSLELAQSSRTPEEEVLYQAARGVLRTGDHDSDKLIAYRKCRDAYLLAEQRYTAASITAASASAPDQQQWEQIAKPLLRREMADLMQSWMLEGCKDVIENAQTQVATLGARSPALTWADWRGHYNKQIDMLSDAMDGTSVAPSGFSPTNAIEEGAWRSFTLTPPEVSALLQEAPPAWLTSMLGTAAPTPTQSISFEFSSAAIIRPWFDPGLFKARFWRFAQQGRQVSDGKSPPTGECPSYVAAVVFARHVQVTGAAAPAPAPLDGFKFLETANISRASVVKRRFTPVADTELDPSELPPRVNMRVRAAQLADISEAPSPVSASLRSNFAPAQMAVQPGVFTAFAAQDRVSPTVATADVNTNTNIRALNLFAAMRVDRAVENRSFADAGLFTPTPSPTAAPLATPAPSPAADPNMVYVLAFICKQLTQCPNPDPTLQW